MPKRSVPKVNLDRLIGEELFVTCIENWTVEPWLTIGKEYKVISISSLDRNEPGWVKIKCDSNRVRIFSKGFFSKNY